MSEQTINEVPKGPLEISDDWTSTEVILQELIKAHKESADRSRERSLVITKLEEARMWGRQAFYLS